MTLTATAECGGCNASVAWYPNRRTGKKAPVDIVPREDGNVVIDSPTGTYEVLTKSQLAAANQATMFDTPRPRYVLHFATCTKPETFRKRDQKAHRAK